MLTNDVSSDMIYFFENCCRGSLVFTAHFNYISCLYTLYVCGCNLKKCFIDLNTNMKNIGSIFSAPPPLKVFKSNPEFSFELHLSCLCLMFVLFQFSRYKIFLKRRLKFHTDPPLSKFEIFMVSIVCASFSFICVKNADVCAYLVFKV